MHRERGGFGLVLNSWFSERHKRTPNCILQVAYHQVCPENKIQPTPPPKIAFITYLVFILDYSKHFTHIFTSTL